MCGFRYPLAVWDGETPVSHEMATCRAERKKKDCGTTEAKERKYFQKGREGRYVKCQ